jgi:hypothetical protein
LGNFPGDPSHWVGFAPQIWPAVPPLRGHILHILALRSGKQVIRIHAGGIVAAMADK